MLYSLKELYLNNNNIKSIVSAAFRLATRIEILSLANNKLEGKLLRHNSFIHAECCEIFKNHLSIFSWHQKSGNGNNFAARTSSDLAPSMS